MKQASFIAFFALACFSLGLISSAWLPSLRHSAGTGDIVAMAWGDGAYGKAFYGAQVYVEPAGTRFVVHARIHLGHGNSLFHDCGLLGTEDSFAMAVERWGKINWEPDGLHIGTYFMPQSSVETHR